MQKYVVWDMDDDPFGNVQHIPIDEYLTKQDVETAVRTAYWIGFSRRGSKMLIGQVIDGRDLVVIFEEIDEEHIRPITAFFRED